MDTLKGSLLGATLGALAGIVAVVNYPNATKSFLEQLKKSSLFVGSNLKSYSHTVLQRAHRRRPSAAQNFFKGSLIGLLGGASVAAIVYASQNKVAIKHYLSKIAHNGAPYAVKRHVRAIHRKVAKVPLTHAKAALKSLEGQVKKKVPRKKKVVNMAESIGEQAMHAVTGKKRGRKSSG